MEREKSALELVMKSTHSMTKIFTCESTHSLQKLGRVVLWLSGGKYGYRLGFHWAHN